jgi:hypothetical protein
MLIASVMGRVVPWEIALYSARGNWKRARLRFRKDFVAVPLNGRQVWTKYYTPREFGRTFRSAGFTDISLRALGLLAPPPYLEGFARRHPRVTRALHSADDVTGAWPGMRACGDHFLIVMRNS